MKNNGYAALKPRKNKFMKLKKLLESFTHKELKHISVNDANTFK